MPKWLKVVLIAAGALFLVLVAAGFFGVMALKRTYHDVKRASELARVDGEVFGMTVGTGACIEETVRRSGECSGFTLTCAPPLSSFLWACVEEASYEASFCAGLPPLVDDYAMVRWGRRTCTRHGQPANEMCAMSLATISGFCEARKTAP